MTDTPVVASTLTVDAPTVMAGSGVYTGIATRPDRSHLLYILEQNGRVLEYNTDKQTFNPQPLIDLTPEITDLYQQSPLSGNFADERGLLNLVFHPEFGTQGSLYSDVFIVMYSAVADPARYTHRESMSVAVPQPDHMTCLVAYQVRESAAATKATGKDILCFPLPQSNHNGGGLAFGPDGYLWIGTGDGGGAGDQHGDLLDKNDPDSYVGNAQNVYRLEGKLLRIEVVQGIPQEGSYRIPSDNPLVNHKGYQEIMHWGFRNPWRMSWDKDDLYVADVGQNLHEMVKKVSVSDRGLNFGWRGYEGNQVFNQTVAGLIENHENLRYPIISYGRDQGVAIVGVARYRGSDIPKLVGDLILADHSGHIMRGKEENGQWTISTLAQLGTRVDSLSVGPSSELYLTTYNRDDKKGYIHQLIIHENDDEDEERPELTEYDKEVIIQQSLMASATTPSALRRAADGSALPARMHIAVYEPHDSKGKIIYSEPGAWSGSIDIARRKAHTAYAFSSDENALTTATLRALSQPTTITQTNGQLELSLSPLYNIGNANPKGGIIEFPGGVPLYKDGKLVGGLGVSGDSSDNDHTVALAAAAGYMPPTHTRADTAANLPY